LIAISGLLVSAPKGAVPRYMLQIMSHGFAVATGNRLETKETKAQHGAT